MEKTNEKEIIIETSPETMTKELTVAELSPEEKKKVDDILAQFDINDSQGILQYGVGAQSNISNFSDSVLSQVKAKDSGEVGETLTNLMLSVKKLDVDGLRGESVMSKIPILNNFVSGAKKFVAQYQTIEHQIEAISDELDSARMGLLKDITLLDSLYEKNKEYLRELDFYILAGEIKIKELQEEVLSELKTKAEETKDTLDAQEVQDITQMINRFEKKIHDLKLSRMVAIQTLPQVRLIQNNDQLLVEKIQSSILNTIPLWKNQVVIAIGLFRQKKALQAQQEVSKATNDLLTKNSELLKDSSLEIAKESEKGIVEIESLRKVHENLLTTIDETIKIQEEGKVKRLEAEVELSKLEEELKQKLSQVEASGELPAIESN